MPNLIHSLDATSLRLLIQEFKNIEKSLDLVEIYKSLYIVEN